jgi:hypothetical protein
MYFQTSGNYCQMHGDGFIISDKEGVEVLETFEMDLIFTRADSPTNLIADISVFVDKIYIVFLFTCLA